MSEALPEEGKIKYLNRDKGFGFIRRDNNPDIFFHVSELVANGPEGSKAIFDDLQLDITVTFTPGEGKKGPEARDVLVQI